MKEPTLESCIVYDRQARMNDKYFHDIVELVAEHLKHRPNVTHHNYYQWARYYHLRDRLLDNYHRRERR